MHSGARCVMTHILKSTESQHGTKYFSFNIYIHLLCPGNYDLDSQVMYLNHDMDCIINVWYHHNTRSAERTNQF